MIRGELFVMTQDITAEAADHATIHCLLQLSYDGTVSVIATRGCTGADAHNMLQLLANGAWPDGITPDPPE